MTISGQPLTPVARRLRARRTIGAVALSILIAACAAPTPSGTPAGSAPASASASASASIAPGSSQGALGLPDVAALLDPTLAPIDLTVSSEAGNTVTATIPATGGELTATGADGTVYTLTIPDDALLVDTEISMTPVATVTGLPTSGEQTHAVQLGPDGLQLEDFATLTIAPPTDLPVDQRVPFGYEGTGTGMFLAFPDVKSSAIRLRLLHFSGYGVTKGLLASLDEVTRRFGGDADARLSSQITAKMAAESALERAGHETPLDYWTGLEALLDDYETEVVQKRVDAADKSCANARLAYLSVLELERWRQLIMVVEEPGASAVRGIAKVALQKTLAHICTQEEYEICRDDHVVHRMLEVILSFNHQREILGQDDPGEWQFEKDTAKKCLTFEVRFVSEGSVTRTPLDVVSKVKATVKISLDTQTLRITGESALINTAIDMRQTVTSDCTVKGIRGGSVFKVTDLSFDHEPDIYSKPATLTTPSQPGVPGKLKDIVLSYLPTETTDNGTIKCPQTPIQLVAGPWWSAIYQGTHGTERPKPDGPYTTKEWKVNDRKEKLGTKDWDDKFPAAGLSEQGSFELYHQPS